MKDFFSKDNVLIQTAADNDSEKKRSKKGDGINAVLILMKDLRDFQDKVESCMEAQDIEEISNKIENFYSHLDEMYGVLLEIASNGIKSVRKKCPENNAVLKQPDPIMMGVPRIPRI